MQKISRLLSSLLICALAVSLSLNVTPAKAASADCSTGGVTCPYVKAFGADVFAGGAFNTVANATDCTSVPGYYKNGGIYAYAKDNGQNSNGGASGQYGVFALGPIDGNSSGGTPYGFYSAGSMATGPGNTKKFYTSFSNNLGAGNWGGNFDGAGGANLSNCIPDYYDMKNNAATPVGSSFSVSAADGQYSGSGAPFTLNGGSVGNKVTVFVSGSVYINSDITYSYSDDTHVPKFALVVKGDIFVAPNVHRLDGLYISQPTNTTSSDGIFWSCHASDPNNNITIWFNQNCLSGANGRLTLNGAVIAKQVNLMREAGHIAGANVTEDVNCDAATASGNQASIDSACANVAEVFNYVPAMVIGGPFFNQTSSSKFQIDSLINLPPVF